MRRFLRLVCLSLLVFSSAITTRSNGFAADIVPPPSCAPDWIMDGEIATYTPDTLYKLIDGEAELYLPYGFRNVRTVRYIDPVHKGNGLVVSVFEMGSLLDAFGIYSNYRDPETKAAGVGAQGFIEESQLMFYQGRYFVQITASGSATQEPSFFTACAAAVSRRLPADTERPKELAYLKVAGLVPSSEKYYADSLLGYGFFGRGLTAEVRLNGALVKAFVVLGASESTTRRAVDAYVRRLKESGAPINVTDHNEGLSLDATDPLYKGIVLKQSGRFVVGVAGLADPQDGGLLVRELIEGLPK
jgi:hypothetical protein